MKTSRRHYSPPCGFSLIEVLFAIVIMGVGVLGIISLFSSGLLSFSSSQNSTTAAIAARTVATRIISEVDPNNPQSHPYLDRIVAGKSWIHDTSNASTPVPINPGTPGDDLWWSCRSSSGVMNPDFLADPAHDDVSQPRPAGLYQIAIFVYRNYKPGKEPVASYTTLVTAGY